MSQDQYFEIWKRSMVLSQPYWTLYHDLMRSLNLQYTVNTARSELIENSHTEREEEFCDDDVSDEEDSGDECDHDDVNEEYLEFIRITRQHQAERDKLKKMKHKKNPELDIEEYYKDISQIDTLVEDNLVEAPIRASRCDTSAKNKKEEGLILTYGGREQFNRIRSTEMYIDEHFDKQYRNLSPAYWPVMPINPKPYLNAVIR